MSDLRYLTYRCRRAYWHARIAWMALKWAFRPCIGDEVIYDGGRWRLTQGVRDPEWTLRRGDPTAFPSDAESAFVDRSEFRKVRTPSNYWGSIRSGWRFYRGYWLDIWARGWRMPK